MPKSISFCTTCRNRLWQLKETLPQNLESTGEDHEIVLVDYGSTDGLGEWIWNNFKYHIENGRLVFFEVRNDVRWNIARAKNLAHRLASGDYLFNLDADNFVTKPDIIIIEKARSLGAHCWQYSGTVPDGSCGRIGVPKRVFDEIGGYDETLLPMGGQDVDILNRLATIRKIAHLPPPARMAIQNTLREKVSGLVQTETEDKKVEETYKVSNSLSLAISKFRLATEGPVRLGGGFSYRGFLNGRPVSIDGFSEIKYNSD